jgi:uncharacterized phage protein gp47/JayE
VAYIDPAVVADDTSQAEANLAAVADRIPGLSPRDSQLLTALCEAIGIGIATALQNLIDQMAAAYEGVGDLFGVFRLVAAEAEVESTWTSTAPLGVIPAGTVVEASFADGGLAIFAVMQDTPAPTVVTTGVPLIATVSGSAMNGVSGGASTTELAGVTIVLDGVSAGGTDEEDVAAFRDRIRDHTQRTRALPITPTDHAAFALDVPGVVRAYAVNRYDPTTGNTDAGGHVTVFADGPTGALGPGALQDLADYFASIDKVLAVTVHVLSPPEVPVTVAVEAEARAGEDRDTLTADAADAITAFFDRAVFDVDESADGRWARPASDSVTVYQVHRALESLFGRLRVTSITINGGLSVSLPGPLSVPVLSAPPTVTIN